LTAITTCAVLMRVDPARAGSGACGVTLCGGSGACGVTLCGGSGACGVTLSSRAEGSDSVGKPGSVRFHLSPGCGALV
jgi:hypothetical protein